MSKGWKQEFDRLDGLRPPDSVKEAPSPLWVSRSSSSNRGDRLSNRGRVILVAVGLFAGAAAFSWSILTPLSDRGTHPGASAAPVVAEVVCGTDGSTQLLTPIVQPQSDGVHFNVATNDSGFLYTQDVTNPDLNWGQDLSTDGSTSSALLPIPPGHALAVGCFASEVARNKNGHIEDVGRYPILQVTDHSGAWVSTDLACDSTATTSFPLEVASVGTNSPESTTRDALSGVDSTDTVELAGYPGWTHPLVLRVVRAGSNVALVDFSDHDAGATLFVTACDSAGIQATSTFRQ